MFVLCKSFLFSRISAVEPPIMTSGKGYPEEWATALQGDICNNKSKLIAIIIVLTAAHDIDVADRTAVLHSLLVHGSMCRST